MTSAVINSERLKEGLIQNPRRHVMKEGYMISVESVDQAVCCQHRQYEKKDVQK
jgi:hypothetical protein